MLLISLSDQDLTDLLGIFQLAYVDAFNLNDLDYLNIDFGIDSIDFKDYLIYNPDVKSILIHNNDVLEDDYYLNLFHEMLLNIPFMSDLEDLNLDIVEVHEKEISAWDK
jgi:hypothetical protein